MRQTDRDFSTDELRRMLNGVEGTDATGDLTMRIWIAAHPNVPPEWVDRVLGIRFVGVRRAAGNLLSTAGIRVPFDTGRDSGVYRALAGNPSVTPTQLRGVWRMRPMFTYPGAAVTALSLNPNTPTDVIAEMTMFLLNKMSPPHGSWPLPAHLIAHPQLTDRPGRALTTYLLSITEHPELGKHAIKTLFPLLSESRTSAWMSGEDQSRLIVAASFLD